jgi:peptidoglycan/xylan/chitin deacetylase (PgdA/CDA1 family)
LIAPALASLVLVAPSGAAGNPSASKIVSLSFDDGLASQGVVDGLLRSRRLRGTFFIITGAVDDGGNNPESLTWAQIRRLADDRNEIAAHTRTHRDLLGLDPDTRSAEICGSRRDLAARGFDAVSFAYPYGDSDAAAEGIVRRCGFSSGRGAWGGAESDPPADAYGLRTLENVTDHDTLAALEAQTTTARPGAWSSASWPPGSRPWRPRRRPERQEGLRRFGSNNLVRPGPARRV